MRLIGLVLIGGCAVLPLIFRNHRWLRILAVALLLAIGGTASFGVGASHLLAIGKAGVDVATDDRFAVGAFATREIAADMALSGWVAALGLGLLALVPERRPSKSQ